MGLLPVVTIVGLHIGLVFGYALEPALSWPREYHFKGENIDLSSHVVKKFEIWYSEERNKSRIDFYDGLVKRVYDAAETGDQNSTESSVYMIHSEADEEEEPKVKCEKYPYYYFEDFLPEVEDYVYSGNGHHQYGPDIEVWKKEEDLDELVKQSTLYVTQEKDFAIPVQMDIKVFNTLNGGIDSHEIANYYNFDSNVQDEDLAVDKNECPSQNDLPYETTHSLLSPHLETDVEIGFNAYKKHHRREYKEAEHKMRKHIYRRNWKLVHEHNSKNLGYKLAMNHFADRTESELRYLTATSYTKPVEGTIEFPYTAEQVDQIAETLPEEYDLRSEGFVSPVQNQQKCGSCWAFASTSAVESAVMKSMDGKMIDLSEQSVVDCAWNYDSAGCEGSSSIGAVFGYLKEYGIPTVRDYGPYLAEDGQCKIKNMTEVYKIREYVAVTPLSQNALKAALFKTGAVAVGVYVDRKMRFYDSGIYFDVDCPTDDPLQMNHAVLAVGYGVRDGDLYWIIKNSWSENWGQDGYLLISANNNNCNVLSSPVYPIL